MYVIAVIGDIIGAIPFVNWVSDPITAIALGMIGGQEVSLYSDENVLATILVIVIKAIPGISIIPVWTIRVYFAKRATRAKNNEVA